MLKSIIGTVQAGITAGKSVDQIKAMKPAAQWDVPGGFISGDAFVETAYKSLTTPGKPAHVAPDNHVH